MPTFDRETESKHGAVVGAPAHFSVNKDFQRMRSVYGNNQTELETSVIHRRVINFGSADSDSFPLCCLVRHI